MKLSNYSIFITILASMVSGLVTAIFAFKKEKWKEKQRREEKAQDMLKMDLKDLQIKLYQLEKDLNEWKEKYYQALQELIGVKAELENTLIKLTHVELHLED